ncbi:MAG: response regulator [Acidobacteriia bacterium]|nr:response regulator [Terriglobia bacterium]
MDLRVLLVCPDQDSANLLNLILPEIGMVADHVPSHSRALQQLDQQRFEAIILDYRSDPSSQEFLSRWRQSSKNRDTMLIAIVDGEFNARPVFGMGANFVLYRPLSAERTRVSLRAARGLMRHERRRAPRTPLKSPASVAYPGAGELNATLNDLSEGGTLLTTADRLPPACKVYFEFSLPGQHQSVRLSGEVAWQDSTGRTGIRFLDVPQASRRLMQAWLQKNGSNRTPGQPPRPPVSAPALDGTAKPKTAPVLATNSGNRRGERRLTCKIGAEVYRLGTTVPNRCTLSDISEGGCYVEMPSPLSGQSGVEILVRTADMKLKIRGQVLATHPGFGMGVRFVFRDSVEREEILRLLAVLSAGPSLDEISH